MHINHCSIPFDRFPIITRIYDEHLYIYTYILFLINTISILCGAYLFCVVFGFGFFIIFHFYFYISKVVQLSQKCNANTWMLLNRRFSYLNCRLKILLVLCVSAYIDLRRKMFSSFIFRFFFDFFFFLRKYMWFISARDWDKGENTKLSVAYFVFTFGFCKLSTMFETI